MSGKTWAGAAPAELDWSGGTPRSNRYQDNYFSIDDGIAESRHVFQAGNNLPGRWRGRDRFTIVETGFGTGLNFLTSWAAWRADPERARRLHMLSIEAFPLSARDLRQAVSSWPELAELGAQLLDSYPAPLPGLHRLEFEAGAVCLDLVLEPLHEALPILEELPDLVVDCWYLDGFAPSRNPDMWTGQLFQCMSRLSAPSASFATFTAAGEVRRGLVAAGFDVTRRAGHGRKREMLTGRLAATAAPLPPADTPWHLPAQDYPDAGSGQRRRRRRSLSTALVLGAGLAGATIADALARRGWPVAVYDQGSVAGGASGNPQGTLYTRISHRESALNSFSLHSYSFASRFYRRLFAGGKLQAGVDGELCGALHLRDKIDEADPLRATLTSLPGIARYLDAETAAALTGLAGCGGGLYYPGSGWLHPAAVCRALLDHPAILVREQVGPLRLAAAENGWELLDANGEQIDSAAVVVVACGTSSAEIVGTDWLRLQSIRGQISRLPSRGELQALKTVICHEGYLPPATAGVHCIGATFDVGDSDGAERSEDHAANLAQLQAALPGLDALRGIDPQGLEGRVGFRCASPDYMPVVGPVPDTDAFREVFAGLQRNARRRIASPGPHRAGLFLSTGHGSRGLTSTPLAAELLAAQITGEPWPVPTALARALFPARFLVRQLIRGRA